MNDRMYEKNSLSTRQKLGLVGAVILMLGVFVPIVDQVVMESTDYFRNGKGGGAIVLILAAVSFFLSLKNDCKKLWFTGVGCLVTTLYSLYTTIQSLSLWTKVNKDMQEIHDSLSQLGINSKLEYTEPIHLQFGWGVLLVGCALLIASAAVKETSKS